MTDKEKLIQLIKTGEQCNIDLGVYQWLAQGFDKTELGLILFGMVRNWQLFADNEIQFVDYRITYTEKAAWHRPWVVKIENQYRLIKEITPILSVELLRRALSDHIEMIVNKLLQELAVPE